MFRLGLRALRARRTQTLAIFALTVLAAVGGSAAPWFLQWARGAVSVSDIAHAPVDQRIVTVTASAVYNAGAPSPIALMKTRVAQVLDVPGGEVSVGARVFAAISATAAAGAATGTKTDGTTGLYLSTRDGICDHVVIDGACPGGGAEVMIGRSTATALNLKVGDQVTFDAFRLRHPAVLRVVGIYEPRDILNPYWSAANLLAGPAGLLQTEVQAAAFVSEPTMLASGVEGLDLDYHLVLPDSAFHDSGLPLQQQLQRAVDALRPDGFGLQTTAGDLVKQIQQDQGLVRDGVFVAALELVALSWFALFLAVRQTSIARRPDIGLLKLRGTPRGQIWLLSAEQSAVPMFAGVVVGLIGGYVAAAILAGAVPARSLSTLEQSALVAAIVGLGALATSVAAEWSALRATVLNLIRRVPTRRSGWRASIIDLVVVALAVAGVYQGYADLDDTGVPSVLSLLAPGLVGLAVALVMARALPWLAARSGTAALTGGHAGATLSALHVARRPGTDRVFAIVVVAVSVLASTVFFWHNARDAWDARADLEVGAARVLVVRAPTTAAVLGAVRTVDPDGRFAMAVARAAGGQSLAVDTTRLAAVALLPVGYGLPDAQRLASLLRPVPATAVPLADGTLSVQVDGPAAVVTATGTPIDVLLKITYADAAGGWHTVSAGPLTDGIHSYDVAVTGCSAGCHLIAFEPSTDRREAQLRVLGLTEGGVPVLTGTQLGDITRWRSQVDAGGIGPLIATSGGALTILVTAQSPPPGSRADNRVFFAGAPVPVPVALAGYAPTEHRAGDPRVTVLGVADVPYEVVATGNVLPAIGASGTLMDLAYAQDASGQAGASASLEVWLNADAPPDTVDRLRKLGVDTLTDTTVGTAVDRLASQGPGLALRFQLFSALVLLVLAAGALVVSSAVERRDRARELVALRTQGLTDAATRFAGYAGALLVVLGGLVTGLLAALLADSTVAAGLPVFTDGWDVLPRGLYATWGAVGLAALLAAVVLVPIGAAGAARLVRDVRRGPGGTR